jgi:two-component system chemotaxis sensor kinase CheA
VDAGTRDGGQGTDGSTEDGGTGGTEATEASQADRRTDTVDADAEDDGSKRQIAEVKSVRVDVDQLDELHELVEQLVTSRIKLRQAVGADETKGVDTLDELDKISSNLQNTVMDMRLIPLKKVFDKFPRLVRDLAREQDKRVDFRVTGQDIELDRTILDEISDPLMHVLRNAVDHGIEPPDERTAAGKPEQGVVELSARREHDTVVVEVTDDGGGLDVDRIREKAVSKGVASREAISAVPDDEVYDYIFHPGFSTNEEITDVSGRGVGMDVVKTTVEALDGSVSVSSTLGEGTTFEIRLPVSVAIIKVLFVTVGDRQFGVPIKYIDEVARESRIETINGTEVVVHDDQVYPLIRLRDALGVSASTSGTGMVVRIRPQDRQVALRCDGVTRQEEVVVTPLQGPLSGSDGLSGTAVIGDGNVIPILDVGTLAGADSEPSVGQSRGAAADGGVVD